MNEYRRGQDAMRSRIERLDGEPLSKPEKPEANEAPSQEPADIPPLESAETASNKLGEVSQQEQLAPLQVGDRVVVHHGFGIDGYKQGGFTQPATGTVVQLQPSTVDVEIDKSCGTIGSNRWAYRRENVTRMDPDPTQNPTIKKRKRNR